VDRRAPQEKGAHEAEHRGVHGNAQRQRKDSNNRESWFLRQHTKGESQISPERLHSHTSLERFT
jgi:hypothetical protein